MRAWCSTRGAPNAYVVFSSFFDPKRPILRAHGFPRARASKCVHVLLVFCDQEGQFYAGVVFHVFFLIVSRWFCFPAFLLCFVFRLSPLPHPPPSNPWNFVFFVSGPLKQKETNVFVGVPLDLLVSVFVSFVLGFPPVSSGGRVWFSTRAGAPKCVRFLLVFLTQKGKFYAHVVFHARGPPKHAYVFFSSVATQKASSTRAWFSTFFSF